MLIPIEPWTVAEIAAACGGTIVSGDGATRVTGVTADSRTVAPRSLFIALKGENHDGHAYAKSVSADGAVAVLVDRELSFSPACAVIRAADTTRSLGALGAAYRARFRPTVVAVTGTSGKTTTKSFLASIYRRRYRTLATTGNLNNHLGVPFTLLGMNAHTERAVIEMGMSDRGEIAYLAGLAAPQIGIITSIGPCHLDRLHDVHGVLDAKAELIAALNASGGTLILDADGFFCAELKARATCRVITVGESADADIPIREVEARGFAPASFRFRGLPIHLRLPGRTAVADAALAAVAAQLSGVDPLDIADGLRDLFPVPGRASVHVIGGITVIDDAYNANPLSFAAALTALRATPANRRVVVMSDMRELGPDAENYHAELGCRMEEQGVDILVHTGPGARIAANSAKGLRAIACESTDEIAARLPGMLLPGDVVLIKASHGTGLHTTVPVLLDSLRPAAPLRGVVAFAG